MNEVNIFDVYALKVLLVILNNTVTIYVLCLLKSKGLCQDSLGSDCSG